MTELTAQTRRLLELLDCEEMPFGLYYAPGKPEGAYGPKPGEPLSREREEAGQINWGQAFGGFTCLMRSLFLARKNHRAAFVSREEYGCMGGGYYCGAYGPYLEMNVAYVTTGRPGLGMEGEHYLATPAAMRKFMDECAPPLDHEKYCVLKPLDLFTGGEEPLTVTFFARPEVLTGLHSLAGYAADSHRAVVAPFGAGCSGVAGWPLVYASRGEDVAVLGGFDISARKFLKADELTFSMPAAFYRKMLAAMEESALTRATWRDARKKVARSRRAWAKGE